jgi:hypothetical protein
LETIREKLNGWLRVELKKIAEVMKFKRLPIIQWGLMSLRDENAERKLWLDLYDRGIVSDQSMLERFGTDFEVEAERQRLEKIIKEQENPDITKPDDKFRAPVMVSRGPFNRDLVTKQQPKPPGGAGGRPVKTGKPQEKKRTTKPKGMGAVIRFQQFLSFAEESLKVISEAATKIVIEAQNIKDSRSLTKAQKQDLEELIVCTLAASDPSGAAITEDLVYNLLDESNRVALADRMDQPRCAKIIATYKAEVSEASTKEERFNLMCNAFAAIYADLLEDNDEEAT